MVCIIFHYIFALFYAEYEKLNENFYHENLIQIIDLYDEEDDIEAQEEFEVIEVSQNRYKTTFHVPQ